LAQSATFKPPLLGLDKIKTAVKLYVSALVHVSSTTLKEKDMPGLNRVQLIGRLGRDPETRFTPTGKKVAQFSIAVGRRWRSTEGEVKEATDWFNVDAWGRLGEICQEYLHKGSLVYLEGRLRTDQYEQGGEKRYFTKVVAQSMQMLDRKAEEEEPAAAAGEEEDFPFE
jgi:single-strand DNA-binding protein